MFAILRVEKLKKMANVSGANNHNQRLNVDDCKGVDWSKTKDNIHIGATDPMTQIKKVWEKHGIKPRKNAVMANEYVLHASPEFFEGKSPREVKEWAKENLEFLKDKHGDGLISFDLHLDESSPHIHAIVTPIYENSKGQMKLSAKHYFDKLVLPQLQTDYAKSMEKFGLERGIEGSRAKHKTIKQYGAELDRVLIKAKAQSKDAIQDFKKMQEMKPSIFNFKAHFSKAKAIVKDLARKIVKLQKLNAALKFKYDAKLIQFKDQLYQLTRNNERLNSLYDAHGISRDDPARFSELAKRNAEQAKEIAHKASEAALEKRRVEQALAGLSSTPAVVTVKPDPRPAVETVKQDPEPGRKAPGLG